MKGSLQSMMRAHRRHLRRLKPLWGLARTILRGLPLHRLPPTRIAHPRPAGSHETVASYLEAAHQLSADHTVPVYPEETLQRSLPETFGNPLPARFAECLRAEVPEASVHVLHGVRFWGHYGGSVIGRDNRLLGDVSPDVWTLKNHKALGCLCLPPVHKLTGTVAVVATAEAESNYWHWMMDALPRFHLLAKAGFPPEKVDWYLTNAKMTRFQRETLKALRVPEEKLVFVSDRTHLEIEKAIVPSIRSASWDVPSWIPSFLRALPLCEVPVPVCGSRLFLSRAGEAIRQLNCEPELIPELEKRGFAVIRPGDYSVAEQRALFAQADFILAPHGAALTNIVFCRAGSRVLDLMNASWVGLYFWGAAAANGVLYQVAVDRLEMSGPNELDRTQQVHMSAKNVASFVSKWLDEVTETRSSSAPFDFHG